MKRYGVYPEPGLPGYYSSRRTHETWHEARVEYDGLKVGHGKDVNWRIWDYASDPPRDVTDADPDAQDKPTPKDAWLLFADAHTPVAAAFKAGEQLERVGFEPEDEQRHYRIYVEDITAPEEPQWWFYQLGEWRKTSVHQSAIMLDVETGEVTSAIVLAKKSEREKVMEELRLARLEWDKALDRAGKP